MTTSNLSPWQRGESPLRCLTDVEEIAGLVPSALAVALVCEGSNGTNVCAITQSDADRLVEWIRAGDPSADPGIRRAVEILETQRPPRLVAYAVGNWHLTLSVVGASCEKRVRPSFCLRPRGERGSADGTQRSQDDSDRHCGRGAGAAGVHGACLPVMRASTREEMRRISSTSRSSSRLFSIHSR